MAKAMNVILGLAFLALGILGITGLVPMFKTDLVYVNVVEIALGSLGLLAGIYSRQGGKNIPQKNESSQQAKEKDQQRKENDLQQRSENDRLRKENEQQREESEQQRRVNYNQWRKENDRQRKENV